MIPNQLYRGKRLSYYLLRKYVDNSIDRILCRQVISPVGVLGKYLATHYMHQWYDTDNFSTTRHFSTQEATSHVIRDWRKIVWREDPTKYMSDNVRNFRRVDGASEQISHMADLIEKYPELLRMACDPSPMPRANWKHVSNGLKARAARALRSRRYYPSYLFHYDFLPIVPSDDSLALFVTGLTKILHLLPIEVVQSVCHGLGYTVGRPLETQNSDETSNKLLREFSSMRLKESSLSELCSNLGKGLDSKKLLQDIQTAVEGMAFVHTLPDRASGMKSHVLRTRWTPWSPDPFRSTLVATDPDQLREGKSTQSISSTHAPVFLSPPAAHLDVLSPVKHDSECLHLYTETYRAWYPKEEFEWLEAYCRTVRSLEQIEHGGNINYQRALDRQAEVDKRI